MNSYMRILFISIFAIVYSYVWGATKTSTLTFTSENYTDNPVRANDGVKWSIETNCSGPNYEEERGVYYMSQSNSFTYVNFKTNSIHGRIKKITMKAAGYDNSNQNMAHIMFYVNSLEIMQGTHLSTQLQEYSKIVDMELESEIYIQLYCPKKTIGLYMKSIEIEYETDEVETIDVNFKETFGGWTSLYYQEKSLIVPQEVTAYTYTVSGEEGQTSITYEPEDVIPKNTAVILKLNSGFDTFVDGIRTVTFEVTDQQGENDPDNRLLGFDTSQSTIGPNGETEGYDFFRFTLNARQDAGSIGFYWGASNGGAFTVGANKAYLALPKNIEASHPASLPLKIIPFIFGDANNDGYVNVTDVMLVVNYLLGNTTNTIRTKKIDVNQDNNVNVSDVMGIVNYILGNTPNQ